jgi:hypothetical protein
LKVVDLRPRHDRDVAAPAKGRSEKHEQPVIVKNTVTSGSIARIFVISDPRGPHSNDAR